MLSILANPQKLAWLWTWKWYDNIGDSIFPLRHYSRWNGGVLSSAANNTTQPAATWKFMTIQTVDFSWIFQLYPALKNISTQLTEDDIFTNANKGIQVVSSAPVTGQKVIQNYLIPMRMVSDRISGIRCMLPVLFGGWNGGNTVISNITVTAILKKVNSVTGTISTIQTINDTGIANINAAFFGGTQSYPRQFDFSAVTGLVENDILYIEWSITCDMSNSSTLYANANFSHAYDANSYMFIYP